MTEKQITPDQRGTDEDVAIAEGVDKGRRAALRNIGALAGAAPAVAVLLSPSVSRAAGAGSPCEGSCGTGSGVAPGWKPSDTGAPGSNTGFLGSRES